jgi:CRP/FNR family transcriptional regulator, dissimilatory nitrate respiration regulator
MQTEPSALDTLIAKLQTVPMLQGLDQAGLAKIARSAIRRTYAPGAVIFLEGDAAPTLYYVDAGWVKVVKISPDGREQILYFWGPGEIFGGVGVFVNRPAPATAIALEATEIWILPRDAIRQMFTVNPAMALHIIEFMADRISELVELVADLSLHTITARLARLLLEQAEGDVVHRHSWATQAEMAARLGTVPDVLSRALRGLVEEGLIEVARHQIRILDHPGLTAKTIPIR